MSPFEKALAFTLSQEGGYSNDPNDSGGETRYGISKSAYPREDIKNLTLERAAEIYKKDYWDKCACGLLPSPLAILLFDGAVNQGPEKAVRLLQSALSVSTDGVVGPMTIQAIGRMGMKNALAAFAGKRAFQYSLHPKVNLYGYGWLRRLAACLMTALDPL